MGTRLMLICLIVVSSLSPGCTGHDLPPVMTGDAVVTEIDLDAATIDPLDQDTSPTQDGTEATADLVEDDSLPAPPDSTSADTDEETPSPTDSHDEPLEATDPIDTVDEETPTGCTSHGECDDGDPCTTDTCDFATGTCLHDASSCPPAGPCQVLDCTEGGACLYLPEAGGACCSPTTITATTFAGSDDGGITIEDLAGNTEAEEAPVVWQLSEQRPHSDDWSLHFGIPGKPSFDNGKVVAAAAHLPVVTLPSDTPSELSFYTYLDVEAGNAWDVLAVTIVAADEETTVWSKGYDVPLQEWVAVSVDLVAFQGLEVAISFVFNSIDFTFNNGEGAYLDDIMIRSGCPEKTCSADEDCADGIPCTAETCAGGECSYELSAGCCAADADCYDADACTIDSCIDAECLWSPVDDPSCCNVVADCDDATECTIDACEGNQCTYYPSGLPGCCESDDECDDFDGCTIDICTEDQTCVHITTCCTTDADCDDFDDICTTDACVSGTCSFVPTGAQGCCTPTVVHWTFDGADPGFSYTSSDSQVKWQVHFDGQSVSGSGAMYYGDVSSMDFDSGDANQGTATSPPVVLAPGYPYTLEFATWFDTESSSYYDYLVVDVVGSSASETVWAKDTVSMMSWELHGVDISGFAGDTIQVVLTFETGDSISNYGEGCYVDDLRITTTCLPAE